MTSPTIRTGLVLAVLALVFSESAAFLINFCDSHPCLNGGVCCEQLLDYSCTCPPGFTGKSCQTNINECASSPCLNGGTCCDRVNGYVCDCAPGFTGPQCQTNVNECSSCPCQNGGVCVDLVNAYHCQCPNFFSGSRCQDCTLVCGPNGVRASTGCSCSCNPGFFMDTATRTCQETNECASCPCQHGGVCTDGLNSYTCACPAGYTGSNCEIDINECSSNPCMNGGTCCDRVNGYVCQCAPGFTGPRCQSVLHCLSAPCQHGATCLETGSGYSCQCPPGYQGTNCEVDINECASYPCLNGGTCCDRVNGYVCQCAPGFQGQNCQSALPTCPALSATPGVTLSQHCGYQGCVATYTCLVDFIASCGQTTRTCQADGTWSGSPLQCIASKVYTIKVHLGPLLAILRPASLTMKIVGSLGTSVAIPLNNDAYWTSETCFAVTLPDLGNLTEVTLSIPLLTYFPVQKLEVIEGALLYKFVEVNRLVTALFCHLPLLPPPISLV